jgi:hypothetical protein
MDSGEIVRAERITGGNYLAEGKKQGEGMFRVTCELLEPVKEAKRDNPGYLAGQREAGDEGRPLGGHRDAAQGQ